MIDILDGGHHWSRTHGRVAPGVRTDSHAGASLAILRPALQGGVSFHTHVDFKADSQEYALGLAKLKNGYGNCDQRGLSQAARNLCIHVGGWDNRYLWSLCRKRLGPEGRRWLRAVVDFDKNKYGSKPIFDGAVMSAEDALSLLPDLSIQRRNPTAMGFDTSIARGLVAQRVRARVREVDRRDTIVTDFVREALTEGNRR